MARHWKTRRKIHDIFEIRASRGLFGTPSSLVSFGKKKKNWQNFISREDKKFSHRIMRKKGTL